jgi:hypothetical protein
MASYVAIQPRPFWSLTEIKREMTALYWQGRKGEISVALLPHLRGLLMDIAKLLREERVEKRHAEIQEKLAALALLAKDTPPEQLPAWLRNPVIEGGKLVVNGDDDGF